MEPVKKSKWNAWQIWPLTLGVIFVLFFLLHKKAALMNKVWWGAVFPMERGLARLCAVTSVSVAEATIISALFAAFFGLTWAIRRKKLMRYLAVLLGTGLTVWAGFCLLWGTAYYADGFQEHAGLYARGGTVEELTELTEHFTAGLRESCHAVPRKDDGTFAVSYQEILAFAPCAWEGVVQEFPFLRSEAVPPKAFVTSRALSALDFTGFYFPFTGEANVNIDSPTAYLPATVCHEMAHQKGYASEQECTFLGILAAVTADSAAYRYSGYLSGYVYLSNALYGQDRETWQAIRDTLPEAVLADLRANSTYWRQFQGPVRTVSNTVYDGFLKVNGDEKGIRSYGTVVDLLLAYGGERL